MKGALRIAETIQYFNSYLKKTQLYTYFLSIGQKIKTNVQVHHELIFGHYLFHLKQRKDYKSILCKLLQNIMSLGYNSMLKVKINTSKLNDRTVN